MSILTANNLSLSFGAFDVFKGVAVRVANDSKIGLIGPNGIGKTSLLLILAGLSHPTTGSASLARGRRIGYLRQEAVHALAEREITVYAEMCSVFAHLQGRQARLHEMEAAMAAGQATEALLEAYGVAQEEFQRLGGYDYEVRIRKTLDGLGLGPNFWEMPLSKLSGGQQTRALLARLLLEKPDLLILDEPTNHLDVEAIEWLERALREWEGAVIVVSHDRYFLDHVVSVIWEMRRSGIEIYNGNYSAYLRQRQERWERNHQVFVEEKARLEKELDFIQRNIARASTNARAVGRLKLLSTDLAVIEASGWTGLRGNQSWLEMDLGHVRMLGMAEAARRVHSLKGPSDRPARLNVKLHVAQSSGTVVFRTQDLETGYPDFPLFATQDIELRRGECAALIGPNGAGKTTFLKTLLGQLQPLGGRVQLGANLKFGYFSQAHDSLDMENSVLNELARHKDLPESQARSYLAQYLFRGDDVFKTVRSLSGGERARLALAILALEGANFLLLDEPTNHLDIPAQEALQEVLEGYPGTVLLVSHDRYLIDRLATQVWELRDRRLIVFKGSYREFSLSRQAGSQAAKASAKSTPAKTDPSKAGARQPAHSGGKNGRNTGYNRVKISGRKSRKSQPAVKNQP